LFRISVTTNAYIKKKIKNKRKCVRILSMAKKRSVVARTPAEKFRDNILIGYPEWPTWSRKLRRIFVSLPSYGVGKEALESMCEDFEWDFEKTSKLIDGNASFTKAVNDFIEDGYRYRTAIRYPNSKNPLPFEIKWSKLQLVYMMESGITSFIKAELGKISAVENKLIEKSGLLEIEPLVNDWQSDGSHQQVEKKVAVQNVDISGESSLFDLEASLNGK